MRQTYLVNYTRSTLTGVPLSFDKSFNCEGQRDHKSHIRGLLHREHADDHNFKINWIEHIKYADNSMTKTAVDTNTDGEALRDLKKERASAVNSIITLLQKARVNAKIDEHRPLKYAYINFKNEDVQSYMLYTGEKRIEYLKHIEKELNIDSVICLSNLHKFTTMTLKPNYDILTAKNRLLKAQELRHKLMLMEPYEKTALVLKLTNKDPVNLAGIDLELEDIVINYVPNTGHAMQQDDNGTAIVDIHADQSLSERYFVTKFKIFMKRLRNTSGLNEEDKIFLEVFVGQEKQTILSKSTDYLTKELLATGIEFLPFQKLDKTKAHRLPFDNDNVFVLLYKEVPV